MFETESILKINIDCHLDLKRKPLIKKMIRDGKDTGIRIIDIPVDYNEKDIEDFTRWGTQFSDVVLELPKYITKYFGDKFGGKQTIYHRKNYDNLHCIALQTNLTGDGLENVIISEEEINKRWYPDKNQDRKIVIYGYTSYPSEKKLSYFDHITLDLGTRFYRVYWNDKLEVSWDDNTNEFAIYIGPSYLKNAIDDIVDDPNKIWDILNTDGIRLRDINLTDDCPKNYLFEITDFLIDDKPSSIYLLDTNERVRRFKYNPLNVHLR